MRNKNKLPQRLLVKVTKKDIDEGCRSSYSFCPIAKAANRTLNKIFDQLFVIVGNEALEVYLDSENIDKVLFLAEYRMSNKGKKFIDDFDTGYVVKPITIALDRIS